MLIFFNTMLIYQTNIKYNVDKLKIIYDKLRSLDDLQIISAPIISLTVSAKKLFYSSTGS